MTPTERAELAYGLVGADPQAALAEADLVVVEVGRAQTDDDVRAVTTAHRAAGLVLRQNGDLVEAEARLRSAIRLAERHGMHEVAGEARMSLAFVLLERGRVRGALATVDHASSVLHGLPAARLTMTRAQVLQRSGRTRQALDDYAIALPVLRRHRDAVWEARLRNNRAGLLALTGDTTAALADQIRARELYLRLGQPSVASDVLWNMGYVLGMAGDYPAAIEKLDESDRELGDREHPERWVGRAEVLLGAGLTDEARAYAERSVRWLESRGWDALEAEARLLLAMCILASSDPDLDQARAESSRAQRMFAHQGRPEWDALARYALATTALVQGSRTAKAVDDAASVAVMLQESGWEVRAADLRLAAALVAIERGDDVRARRILGPLSSRTRGGRVDVRGRAWFARALLAERDGRIADSLRALRTSWTLAEAQRSLLGGTEMRVAGAAHARDVVRAGTRLAVARWDARAVFAWSESGRVAALRYPAVAAGRTRDGELDAGLTRLRWAAQAEEEARLVGLPSDRLAADRRRCEADVLRLSRRADGARTGLATVTTDDVRARIGDRMFVHLVVAGASYVAVVLTRDGVSLEQLGPTRDVRDALDTVRFGLRRAMTGFGSVRGREAAGSAGERAVAVLDNSLIRPLHRHVGDSGVVICPSADLVGTPWSTLPTLRGKSVSIAPSATLWCRAVDRRPSRQGRVTVVAGPGLPGAYEEAQQVSALHAGSTCLVGEDATVARALAEAARSQVLHLAAHGRLRADNPLFSAVELADGPLTCYDLESLPRVARTVVLSACSSGAGHAKVADETLGFAWTLMGLGTSEVAAPLLDVPDDATTVFMVAVHEGLRAGTSLARSVADAQAAAADDGPVAAAVASAFVAYGV